MAKILVVEDNQDLAANLQIWLHSEHHVIDMVHDGLVAMEHLNTYVYDIIILDWDLPGMSGIEIIKAFRGSGRSTPIIMLTGKHRLQDKELSFEQGADDYLTKPFEVRELSARIKALLRRPAVMIGNTLKVGNIELDPTAHKARRGDEEIELLPKEFALLEFFMRNPGQIFSPETILERVWQSESESSIEAVYTYVKRLRSKIDTNKNKKSLIKTVYGIGYRMEAE